MVTRNNRTFFALLLLLLMLLYFFVGLHALNLYTFWWLQRTPKNRKKVSKKSSRTTEFSADSFFGTAKNNNRRKRNILRYVWEIKPFNTHHIRWLRIVKMVTFLRHFFSFLTLLCSFSLLFCFRQDVQCLLAVDHFNFLINFYS